MVREFHCVFRDTHVLRCKTFSRQLVLVDLLRNIELSLVDVNRTPE